MNLPIQYQWLAQEPAPKMLVEAIALYGITEKSGPGNNPVILAWAKECGIAGYAADSVPWCGLFMAVVARRAGKPLPPSPLWARSWARWGTASPRAALGDVLTFAREGGGHVGLYVGEDAECYHVLGGNQGDAVCIRRIGKARRIAVRRCYRVAAPANVRAMRLDPAGEVSKNEA